MRATCVLALLAPAGIAAACGGPAAPESSPPVVPVASVAPPPREVPPEPVPSATTTPTASASSAPPRDKFRPGRGRCGPNACEAGEICIEQHTGAVMTFCVSDDPCAGKTPSCACASALCRGLACSQVMGGARGTIVYCSSGTLAP